jgi:hypothetical protein
MPYSILFVAALERSQWKSTNAIKINVYIVHYDAWSLSCPDSFPQLKRDIGMLLLDFRHFLGTKDTQIVANQSSSILRVDNAINKSSLCSNHGVCKAGSILRRVLFKVLRWKLSKEVVSHAFYWNGFNRRQLYCFIPLRGKESLWHLWHP